MIILDGLHPWEALTITVRSGLSDMLYSRSGVTKATSTIGLQLELAFRRCGVVIYNCSMHIIVVHMA